MYKQREAAEPAGQMRLDNHDGELVAKFVGLLQRISWHKLLAGCAEQRTVRSASGLLDFQQVQWVVESDDETRSLVT